MFCVSKSCKNLIFSSKKRFISSSNQLWLFLLGDTLKENEGLVLLLAPSLLGPYHHVTFPWKIMYRCLFIILQPKNVSII